jgi:hypothetical protein
MPYYYVRDFERTLRTDENERVVAAEISEAGTRSSSMHTNLALVEVRDGGDSEEDSEGVICGYDSGNGPCQRTVSDPDERCWQHEE